MQDSFFKEKKREMTMLYQHQLKPIAPCHPNKGVLSIPKGGGRQTPTSHSIHGPAIDGISTSCAFKRCEEEGRGEGGGGGR